MDVPFYLLMQASVKKACCSKHHNQGSVEEEQINTMRKLTETSNNLLTTCKWQRTCSKY